MEISGIEPLTSCLQGRRSPSWAKPPNILIENWKWKMESYLSSTFNFKFSTLTSRSGGPRTRFSAEKPRLLQHATGMLPSAAFRVHFGFLRLYFPDCRLLDSRSFAFQEVVGQNGLEPSTSRLSVVCSSQLSYWPISFLLHFSGAFLSIPCKLNNASSLNTLFWP